MKNQYILKNITLLIVITGLYACSNKEDEKVKFMHQGQQFFQAGEYKNAQLAFEKILEFDPKNIETQFQIAEALSKQGDVVKAFESYQQVIKQDDQHVMARVRAGQLFLLNGQLDNAEIMMHQAIAIQPDNIEVLMLNANVNMAKNNTDAAIVSTEKALKIESNSSSAMIMMAAIYVKTGKIDSAIKLLQQGLINSVDNEEMYLMLAHLFIKNQQYDKAESQLMSLVKLQADSFLPYQRLANFYMATHQADKAEEIIRDAGIQCKESETAQLYLIDFLAEQRNVDVAISELLPMIEQQKKAYSLQFKLVSLQLKKGDIEPAIATLKEIIELDKEADAGIKARNSLASLYASSQRLEQAFDLVSAVLALQPEEKEALMLRGQILLAKKKITEAISDFRLLLQNQPDNLQALKLLASAHVANNDRVLAVENLQKIVAIASDDETARQDLITLMISLGNYQQAEQHIDVLLKQHPQNKKALESLFKVRLIQKDWESVQQISQLFQHDANNEAIGHYMSGMAYQAEGKLYDSIDAFKQALKIKADAIEPLTQLINNYVALDKSKKAVSYLKKLLKTDKDNFIAYSLLGDLYLRKNYLDDAERAYRRAIKIKPQWAQIYQKIAKISLLKDDKSAAMKILQKGINKTDSAVELVDALALI